MIKSKKFTHKGHEFEIRAVAYDHGWKVQVLRAGKAESPAYNVSHGTATDFHTSGWGNAVDALMALAQEDIENDRLPELKKPIAVA